MKDLREMDPPDTETNVFTCQYIQEHKNKISYKCFIVSCFANLESYFFNWQG